MHTFCTLCAHFLQQMIQVLQTSCTLILYLQTFCRIFAHFLQITCFHSAGFMHTYFRPDADLMQIKLMHCRILADSMHTLRRANQCHYNAAARPRGPSGEGGTLCDALLLPQEGEAAAREGEAEAREGEAEARDGEAEAREGEATAREGYAAVRPSALDVLLPAATAAPRASGIHTFISFDTPATSSSHDEYRAGRAGDREELGPAAGGKRSAPWRA